MAKQPGPKVRTVRFREKGKETILKPSGPQEGLPSSGEMRIEEDTGRIVRTELRVMRRYVGGGETPVADIVTTFAFDAELGMNVPTEMRDWYPSRATAHLSGTATYSRFRRFQVDIEERIRR